MIVPYAGKIHEITRRSIEEHAPEAELVDVSGDDFAYSKLFCGLWADSESFLIVEHDIEVTARAIAEAKNCGCLWGVSAYPHGQKGGFIRHALGFARFSEALIRQVPDAPQRALQGPATYGVARGHWIHWDGAVWGILNREGLAPHVHSEVGHHHWWATSEGECCTCGSRIKAICPSRLHHLNSPECNLLAEMGEGPLDPALVVTHRAMIEAEIAKQKVVVERANEREHQVMVARHQQWESLSPQLAARERERERWEREALPRPHLGPGPIGRR